MTVKYDEFWKILSFVFSLQIVKIFWKYYTYYVYCEM